MKKPSKPVPIQKAIRPRAQTESVQGRHFYSHLIEIDIIYAELESMEMSKEEKDHLRELVASNIHHSVLDTVLSNLATEDKKIFLTHLAHDDHDKIWKHLRLNVSDIENKIKKVGKELLDKYVKDIQEAVFKNDK